jgi:predicted nucleic acid-binding protein
MLLDRAVVNAGPLVGLSIAGRLDLLPALFKEFWIPETVFHEVAVAGLGRTGADALMHPRWAPHVRPSPVADPLLIEELDPGEASVITLARSLQPCIAIIDERRGRTIAQKVYGLQVKGTAGLLVEGYRLGLVIDVRTALLDLRRAGYFLSDAVIEAACLAAS